MSYDAGTAALTVIMWLLFLSFAVTVIAFVIIVDKLFTSGPASRAGSVRDGVGGESCPVAHAPEQGAASWR